MEKSVSMVIDCPQCKGKAVLTESIIEIPLFGKSLFSNLRCNKCNFNLNDVSSDSEKEPFRFSAKISSEKDLTVKIVKSSTSTVKIPELGIRIEPAPASQGYFTNIEGLLNKIDESISVFAFSEEEKDAKNLRKKLLQKIQEAKNAKFPFTVIVEDPFGNGALLGKKVKKEKLSEKEVFELKTRMNFLEH